MSLTPRELEELKKQIAATVAEVTDRKIANAISKLSEDMAQMKDVDRRFEDRFKTHSGKHRDLSTNVRRSLSEVRETTNDDLLDACRIIDEVLQEIRKEQGEVRSHLKVIEAMPGVMQGTEAAAIAGAKASIAANTNAQAAASNAIDTKLAVKQNTNALSKQTLTLITTGILVPLIIGLIQYFHTPAVSTAPTATPTHQVSP